jgi:hypothetical protein
MNLESQNPSHIRVGRTVTRNRHCQRDESIDRVTPSTVIGLVLTVSSFEEDHVCLRHILRGSTRITQQQAHTCTAGAGQNSSGDHISADL